MNAHETHFNGKIWELYKNKLGPPGANECVCLLTFPNILPKVLVIVPDIWCE